MEAMVDPAAAWSAWTMTQRRELLRLLFAGIAIKHVGYRNGPRVDPGRLVLTCAGSSPCSVGSPPHNQAKTDPTQHPGPPLQLHGLQLPSDRAPAPCRAT